MVRFEGLKGLIRVRVCEQDESITELDGNENVGDSIDKELDTIPSIYRERERVGFFVTREFPSCGQRTGVHTEREDVVS